MRAITRVATKDNEAALLDIARHATASQAERIFRQYRQTLASTESSGPATSKNAFSWHWDTSGNLVFRGVLSPEQGAVVLAALQQATEAGAHQVDALAVVAHSALSATAETRTSVSKTKVCSAERYQIHVELDHHTQHIRNGPGITDKIIEHLSCDASIITHRCNADDEPLNVGRKTRTIPPAVRRALMKRDQGCRFPGCTHQRFVDAHHIQHWAHGGETKLSNLVMLCSAHHKRVHESGFRIEVDVEAGAAAQRPLQPRFFDPNGQEIRPIVRPVIQGQVIPLVTSLSASAESAGESNDIQTNASPLASINATRCPDYQHINWVLTNFHPPGCD